jgi:hypothetical protein
MPHGSSTPASCKECNASFDHLKRLSDHLRISHGSTSVDYYTKHMCSGMRPSCPECGAETRFVSLGEGFKQYCGDHYHLAEREAGRLGGLMRGKQTCSAQITAFVRELGPRADGKQVVVACYDLAQPELAVRGTLRQRFLAAQSADVRLIQFFSDEWLNKGEVCRSMIANALGKSSLKLHARDCELVTLQTPASKAFIDANHISGATRAKHHVGLLHEVHGLVGVASTRTPIQKKHGHVAELARMCFLRGTSVRGGASKLLSRVKELAIQDGFQGLLSYAELRYGEGHVYEHCGLTLVAETTTNYWYTDGARRYDRFKFRAQPGKPEKVVAEEAHVRSVWGCGNKVYLVQL